MNNLLTRRYEGISTNPVFDWANLSLFFLMGVGLMYIGYFNAYSDLSFIIYLIAIILAGSIYLVYFYAAAPAMALFNWLFFFLFFPKKELRPADMQVLLNVGMGFNNAYLSMYQVLDVFLVLTMLLIMLKHRSDNLVPPLGPKVNLFYRSYFILVLIGSLHFILVWFNLEILENAGYDRLFTGLWALIVGLVIFKFSRIYIFSKKHVETIFGYAIIASLLLAIEYFLTKHTTILPQQFIYYSLNYRQAFRSFFQSGDLFVTQILIFGGVASLYFFLTRNKLKYLLLNLIFMMVVFETYNRGSFWAYIFMTVIILGISLINKRNKLLMAFIIILFVTSGYVVITDILLPKAEQHLKAQETAWGRSGYLSDDSLISRTGAYFRGLEVFLEMPLFGCGPGNISTCLGSSKVTSFIEPSMLFSIGSASYNEYYTIKSGNRMTNTHNLYINNLAEYGMFWIVVLGATINMLFSNFHKYWLMLRRSNNEKVDSLKIAQLCSYMAIFSYMLYFMFQAMPLIYGLLFLLVRITIIKPNEWLNTLVSHAGADYMRYKKEVRMLLPDANRLLDDAYSPFQTYKRMTKP